MLHVLVKTIIFLSVWQVGTAIQLKKLQRNHVPQQLSDTAIQYLASQSDTPYFNRVLNKILIPRVVGTKNHDKVFNFIKSELESFGWDVDVDEFQDTAPRFGPLTFRNIIGTLNPDADRYLVLACHYDSKYFKNEVFVGATDSAVPCAMMLNLAKTLKPQLDSIKSNTDLSLKLIFFDGEEAFVKWGPRDSIYGARHLAGQYHRSRSVTKSTGESVSDLQKIDVLILLDLIGASHVNFYNYFDDTTKWFNRLVEAEGRLDNLGLFHPRPTQYFVPRSYNANIEDDHIPFLKKNVPILHLIPLPFPNEWHTPADNKDLIDINAVENLNKILRIFITEYLHISDYLIAILLFTKFYVNYSYLLDTSTVPPKEL